MTIKRFSFLLVFLGACAQWDAPQTFEDEHMALSTNYITPVVDPNSLIPGNPAAKIYEVQAGTTTNKNDIDTNNQTFENKVATLTAVKVDIAGDTMTGALIVTPTVPANAITGNGNGVGAGLVGVGGATGPGISAGSITLPTAIAPTAAAVFNGYIKMTGADPNPTVDPGANNAIHGANTIKSWVVINDSYVIQDGYNVASITNVLGSIYQVNFVRPMANANYGVKIHVHGAAGYSGCHNGTANKTVNGFQFVIFKTDSPGTLGFGTATEAFIEVTGRQ